MHDVTCVTASQDVIMMTMSPVSFLAVSLSLFVVLTSAGPTTVITITITIKGIGTVFNILLDVGALSASLHTQARMSGHTQTHTLYHTASRNRPHHKIHTHACMRACARAHIHALTHARTRTDTYTQ